MIAKCKPSKRKTSILALYIVFLFGTSLIPMDGEIRGFEFLYALKPVVQNLLHIPLFVLLSILWLQVIQGYGLTLWKRITFAYLLSSLIGIVNEFIQILVPGRYPSMTDLALNLIGAVLGIILYYGFYRTSDSFFRRLVCE